RHQQTAQEAKSPAPRRPAHPRRLDLARPNWQPMGRSSPRVRPQIDRPRALLRVGPGGRLRTGLGKGVGGIRPAGRSGLDLASCRWLHGQSAAGEKGAAGEAEATGRNPTDRAKCGVKRHLLTDGKGVPRASILSGANRTDMKKLCDLLDAQVLEMPALV